MTVVASNSFDAVMWIPLGITELITFVLTLRRTYLIYKRCYGRVLVMSSFIDVIIKDNIVYFAM